MSFSVGIAGLPNVGKSTLFKALTKKKVDIADYPFTTIDPNVGIVPVPDKRLEKIAEIVKPEKKIETMIKFIDIAGLVKNAHKGEGMGNQFLSQIRPCNAIVEVINNFNNASDTENDIKTIENELLIKDLESLSAFFRCNETQRDRKKLEVFEKIKKYLSEGTPIREIELNKEEKEKIKEYQFLTEKPIIYLFNTGDKSLENRSPEKLDIDLKIEEEASELSENEKKELNISSKLDELILACYNTLDLITFFTIKGGKEVRAWTLKKGMTAYDAAEKVHSDFAEKFVRAEILNWRELIDSGSWTKAKESGKVKTAGKDYIVSDGDIIEFKI